MEPERLKNAPRSRPTGTDGLDVSRRSSGDLDELERAAAELSHIGHGLPRCIDADEQNAGRGLARLVLTLVELLRRLLEKQAVRRMEAGSLTDDEIERMGLTFLKLAEKLGQLKEEFGLTDEDLEMDLGSVRDVRDLEDEHGRTA